MKNILVILIGLLTIKSNAISILNLPDDVKLESVSKVREKIWPDSNEEAFCLIDASISKAIIATYDTKRNIYIYVATFDYPCKIMGEKIYDEVTYSFSKAASDREIKHATYLFIDAYANKYNLKIDKKMPMLEESIHFLINSCGYSDKILEGFYVQI